jgi:hypothetical protein
LHHELRDARQPPFGAISVRSTCRWRRAHIRWVQLVLSEQGQAPSVYWPWAVPG